jgi:hypothetical protein
MTPARHAGAFKFRNSNFNRPQQNGHLAIFLGHWCPILRASAPQVQAKQNYLPALCGYPRQSRLGLRGHALRPAHTGPPSPQGLAEAGFSSGHVIKGRRSVTSAWVLDPEQLFSTPRLVTSSDRLAAATSLPFA